MPATETPVPTRPEGRTTKRRRGNVLTPEQLAQQTVVLEVRIGAPSFKRSIKAQDVMKDRTEAEDDKIDPTMLHMRKDLIDPAVLEALGGLRAKFVRWLDARSVSCSMLARGMSLIPLPLVQEVDAGVSKFIKDRTGLVAVLLKDYDAHRTAAKKRLGPLYQESDYPTVAEVRAAFTVRRRFLSFNVPAALENLNKEIYDREKRRVEAEWATAGTEIERALGEAMAGLVEHLSEKLTPGEGEDAKPKTFRDTTVTKLTDFLATFQSRNLTGSADLANLARQAQQLLDGVAPDDLRKQQDVRDRVLKGMGDIKAKLAKMDIVAKPTRRFVAED